MSATCDLLVYESEPRNAAVLARLGDVKLREVRSLMQLKRAMESEPARIVGIEVTEPANLPAVANLVRTMKQQSRHLAVIAMPRNNTIGFEANPWLYEAGVDLIFASILHRAAATRLVHRVVSRPFARSMADAEQPFRGQVISQMPWKRFAS